MKTVFLDRASLDLGDLDLSALEATSDPLELHERSDAAVVLERIGDADTVIVNKVVLGNDVFSASPRLRLVLVVATGTNNVDLEAASAHGITVCNCRGYGSDSVAQHVLTLILALGRGLMGYHEAVRRGEWSRAPFFCMLDYPIYELNGRRLGIIGGGDLGQAVARLGAALGMEVRFAERPNAETCRPDRTPFEQVLAESDIVSVHCPLTPDTRGLIGEAELRRMPAHAIVVNTARGGIVDEPALAKALREGWIGGAGVDVLSEEPPPANHPLLAADIPNLIVTPHCAWGSREARQRVVDQTVENIESWRRGETLRQVTA